MESKGTGRRLIAAVQGGKGVLAAWGHPGSPAQILYPGDCIFISMPRVVARPCSAALLGAHRAQIAYGMAKGVRHKKTRWFKAGFLGNAKKGIAGTGLNYFSLISLYSTCLRAFGSNFMISIFSGVVFLFLSVV